MTGQRGRPRKYPVVEQHVIDNIKRVWEEEPGHPEQEDAFLKVFLPAFGLLFALGMGIAIALFVNIMVLKYWGILP
jgi:hypothetical protein